MEVRYYRDMIVRAVFGQITLGVADSDTLDRIANHLAECEEAKSILRAKGYGEAGTSVVAVARAVPEKAKP